MVLRNLSLLAVLVVPVIGQTPASKAKPASAAWAAPKTPWGDPDLQGAWTSDDTRGVPMERPAQFGDRLYVTEQELADREKTVQRGQERLFNPGDAPSPARAQAEALAKGNAPAPQAGGRGVDIAPAPGHWVEAPRRASKQTSQVIDPPNGRIPALTAEAQKRLAAKNELRRARPASWENWSHYDRCITRGVGGSIIPVIYGNGLEIVQSPGFVSIRYEMVHDHRIIPLTKGATHPGSNVRSYTGDPIGHWEGNTLVVETTNFIGGALAIGGNGDGGAPYTEQMRMVEKFTRTAPNSIDYEATIDDPGTYVQPWKIAFPITQEPGYQLFEYACHEGNLAIRNSLSAARADDAADAAKKK